MYYKRNRRFCNGGATFVLEIDAIRFSKTYAVAASGHAETTL